MITPDVNKIKLSEKRDDDEKHDSRKEIHREQHRLEKIEVCLFFSGSIVHRCNYL